MISPTHVTAPGKSPLFNQPLADTGFDMAASSPRCYYCNRLAGLIRSNAIFPGFRTLSLSLALAPRSLPPPLVSHAHTWAQLPTHPWNLRIVCFGAESPNHVLTAKIDWKTLHRRHKTNKTRNWAEWFYWTQEREEKHCRSWSRGLWRRTSEPARLHDRHFST